MLSLGDKLPDRLEKVAPLAILRSPCIFEQDIFVKDTPLWLVYCIRLQIII
jgi:hypothetical protein